MNFTPSPEWIVQLAASVENLELDGEASETSSGIGFTGNPFMTDLSGSGDIERDTSWINADVSYLLNARVSIVGGFSRNDLDQNGDFSFGISEGLSEWKIATTGVEGGVQYAASESVTLTGGLRYESRDVDFGHAEGEPPTLESHETTHAGFFFTVNWSPRPLFNVNAQIESGSYDDPFTLASPSFRLRFRVQASSQLESGIFVAATYVGSRLENDDRPPAQLASDANWNADRDHINVRVGYRSAGVQASAGYAFVRAENSVNQTILAGAPLLFPILFESDANFADGRFRWSVNPIWRVGGDLRFYDNDGSFALKRNDFRVYGETTVAGNYLVNVGYRYVDYEEKTFGFNDYDAGIVEASIGYAW